MYKNHEATGNQKMAMDQGRGQLFLSTGTAVLFERIFSQKAALRHKEKIKDAKMDTYHCAGITTATQ